MAGYSNLGRARPPKKVRPLGWGGRGKNRRAVLAGKPVFGKSGSQTPARVTPASAGYALKQQVRGIGMRFYADRMGNIQLVGNSYAKKAARLGWKEVTLQEAAKALSKKMRRENQELENPGL